MHELSIASSIVETVTQEIQRRQLPRVQTIALRVGTLSGVVPEALEFGFCALVADTPLANTKLLIEQVPLQGNCHACGLDFTITDFIFACPSCQSGQIDVTKGDELEIAYLEVEDGERRDA